MLVEVPAPGVKRGQLLVQTRCTLVSPGTERMLVEFGKAGWIEKARQQPDKVRAVVDKVRTDGLQPTVAAVMNKLDQPLALGYCNVGVVVDVGAGVTGFARGERVVSNGKHAEVVSVPTNLCAKVPNSVSDEEAAFTVLGAIALQGVRLVEPTLGEAVVVTGLGLVGLLTVQLLRANGCRVLGIDFDRARLDLARRFGAEVVDLAAGQDPIRAAQDFSRGRGVDAVLITAATRSSEPVHQAALMCRQRGRIVLVGVTGLELSRDDFYKKELTFQVSASYGPGRYDPGYEEKGHDYPVGFVRWTEQRNFEAVLDMMSDGRLDVEALISHRFAIEDAERAYELVGGGTGSLGILLDYRLAIPSLAGRTIILDSAAPPAPKENANRSLAFSFIGSGNYASAVLIPAFKSAGVRLRSVASGNGVSGVYAGRKFGFEETTTDSARIFSDSETTAVVVSTRHDTHAELVLASLRASKHVFVEKPLCLTLQELAEIEAAYVGVGFPESGRPLLMVGYNRRFAPHVRRLKELLQAVPGPKSFVMTVNAGSVDASHWTQDPEVGGGRLLGEACHFIDLLRFLAECPISDCGRTVMRSPTGDTATLVLRFDDGSIGTIHYFANGNKSFPKERLEVFAQGRILQLDNFRRMRGFGWTGFNQMNLWRQDKGQRECARAFAAAVNRQGPVPIPFHEIVEVTRISIQLAEGV